MLMRDNWSSYRQTNPLGSTTISNSGPLRNLPNTLTAVNNTLQSMVQSNIAKNNTDVNNMYPGPNKPSQSEDNWFRRTWNSYTGFLKWEYDTAKSGATQVWDTVTTPFRTVRTAVGEVGTGIQNTVTKVTDTLQVGLYAAIAVGGIILIGYARQALK